MSKKKRQVYEFDNFRLDARERQLSRDGELVTLPSKAFDLLLVLIENNGRLVEKDELYQSVWGDQVVEESNLTVQMSSIRKALGERIQNPRYVVTVPGFGYRFVGDVISTGKDREFVIETETGSGCCCAGAAGLLDSSATLPADEPSRLRTNGKQDRGLERPQARSRIPQLNCSRSLERWEAQGCLALSTSTIAESNRASSATSPSIKQSGSASCFRV
jgi:DNA-binding winged helix-turn-helix (wHTH) protein